MSNRVMERVRSTPSIAVIGGDENNNHAIWVDKDLEIELVSISKEELTEDGLPSKVLEFMGLPKSYRRTLYDEFVQDVQVLSSIPSETASSFYSLVNWVCGKSDGENLLPKNDKKEIDVMHDIPSNMAETIDNQIETSFSATPEAEKAKEEKDVELDENANLILKIKEEGCASETSIYGCLEEETEEEDRPKTPAANESLPSSKQRRQNKRVTFAPPSSETNIYAYHANDSDESEEEPLPILKEEDEEEEQEEPLPLPEQNREAQVPLPLPQQNKEEQLSPLSQQNREEQVPSLPQQNREEQVPPLPQQNREEQVRSLPQQNREEQVPSLPQQNLEEQAPPLPQQNREEQAPPLRQQNREEEPRGGGDKMDQKLEEETKKPVDESKHDEKPDPPSKTEEEKPSSPTLESILKQTEIPILSPKEEKRPVPISNEALELDGNLNLIQGEEKELLPSKEHDETPSTEVKESKIPVADGKPLLIKVKNEEKKEAETHVWKERVQLSASVCEINEESILSMSNSGDGTKQLKSTEVDKINANFAPVIKSSYQQTNSEVQTRSVKDSGLQSVLHDAPSGNIPVNTSKTEYALPVSKPSLNRVSFNLNPTPIKENNSIIKPTPSTVEIKDKLNEDLKTSTVEGKDKLNEDLKTSAVDGKDKLNEDLKTLEEIVKKLYKSLNKKGPLTIVANLKTKKDGELQLDFDAKSKQPPSTSPSKTVIMTSSSSQNLPNSRQRSEEQLSNRAAETIENQDLTPKCSLQKFNSSTGLTGIMKTSSSLPNQIDGRKQSVSFASKPAMSEGTVMTSKPSVDQIDINNNSYSRHALIKPIQLTEKISLTVHASTTQLAKNNSSSVNASNPPMNFFDVEQDLNGNRHKYAFPQQPFAVYDSQEESEPEIKIPSTCRYPSLHTLSLKTSVPHTKAFYPSQMRIIQPCSKHTLQKEQPSIQVIQESSSNASSVSSSGTFVCGMKHSLDSNIHSCPYCQSNPIYQRQSSTLSTTSSTGDGESKKKKVRVYIPQPPPSQRHNSYMEMFRHKQQQMQTVYLDLTSKGMNKEQQGQRGRHNF